MDPDKPRLLGRGVPPSQPVPQHLAPASLEPKRKPQVPKQLITASGVLVAFAVAVALAVLLGYDLVVPTPRSVQPCLAAFVGSASARQPIDVALASGSDMRMKTDLVTVDRVWIDSCRRPGPGRTPPKECDRQPFFERALVKAIVQHANCAAEHPKDESISYALEVDFGRKKTRLFAGRSGSLRAAEAKPALECVRKALPEPDWNDLAHDHTRYIIGVLATYPAVERQ